MLIHQTGKGTLWELRIQTGNPDAFETFVSDELTPLVADETVASILLIRGDTTSEGTEFWMLLNGVLEGHAGVMTTIGQHFTASWKPLGTRIFNSYGEEKNILPGLAGYGQEKDDHGRAK
jgi:hypothetical protein